MRILILSWSGGENDPFAFFSEQLRRRLLSIGHEAYVVPLEGPVASSIEAIHRAVGVDLVIAWQGLGSALRSGDGSQTIWERLRLPLVCLHGDHPSHNPSNHTQSSPYLLHVYWSSFFESAANWLIPRELPGVLESSPNLFEPVERYPEYAGDFFVLPKNYTHVADLRAEWRNRIRPDVRRLLDAGADAIIDAYRKGNKVNHHEVILEFLQSASVASIHGGPADAHSLSLVHFLIRTLDQVHRNTASEFVLDVLADVPIRIYGRGWEAFKARRNPNHVFLPFDRLETGASQYHTQYGILDIAPANDLLHDRSFRAMRMGAGFLISSEWKKGEAIHDGYSDLFFGGDADELLRKAEKVREDPVSHRARVQAFTNAFDACFPLEGLLERTTKCLAERGVLAFM